MRSFIRKPSLRKMIAARTSDDEISWTIFLPLTRSRRTVRSSTPRLAAACREYEVFSDNLSEFFGRPAPGKTSPFRTMISSRRAWWSARWASVSSALDLPATPDRVLFPPIEQGA